MMLEQISGVRIPDSKIAREVTQFVRETESDLLFDHSIRVYFWGALAGNRMGLSFDQELLYAAAMFHDIGLTQGYENSQLRFEVDGANAARDFLAGQGISESDIETVSRVQTHPDDAAGQPCSTSAVEVVSLVGGHLEPTKEIAAKYDIGHATTNLADSLARDDVEAVILCTPTRMHADQAIQCMDAGKHVQVEIPLADSLADAEAVFAKQQETGLTCMVGHTRRFNPSHQFIHKGGTWIRPHTHWLP